MPMSTIVAGKTTQLVLDFDACKSVVRRGNSGQFNLRPVISAIPLASEVGLRVTGYVAAGLANASTKVSVQLDGVPVRSTAPESTGRFVLYPVPSGAYDLVVTSGGRVVAVVTGVPVTTAAPTMVSSAAPADRPPALDRARRFGDGESAFRHRACVADVERRPARRSRLGAGRCARRCLRIHAPGGLSDPGSLCSRPWDAGLHRGPDSRGQCGPGGRLGDPAQDSASQPLVVAEFGNVYLSVTQRIARRSHASICGVVLQRRCLPSNRARPACP